MTGKHLFFGALEAQANGEAAREAQRRAMYARPDALPLPADERSERRGGWLARILGGAGRDRVRNVGRSTSSAGSE